jgi:hypothetical protein
MIGQLRFESGKVAFEVDKVDPSHRFLAVDPDMTMVMACGVGWHL